MKKSLWIVLAVLVVAGLATILNLGQLTQTASDTSSSGVSTSNTSGAISHLLAGTLNNHYASDQYDGDFVSFPLFQTILVTVFAASSTATSLTPVTVPSYAWVYFAQNQITATPAGAVANLTMMGAVETDQNLSEAQALVVGAGSAGDSGVANTTTFYVRPESIPFLVVHNSSSAATVIPNVSNLGAVDENSSGTDPWTLVYDPSTNPSAPHSLNVSLEVLGLEVNGAVQPMPNFLRVGFLNSTFTLNEYQPAFNAVHVWNNVVLTAIGSHESYEVAVKETINGLSQIAYLQVEIYGPTGQAG